MKIAIGSDKSGYRLYSVIKEYLQQNNYEVLDYGPPAEEKGEPYFQVAAKVAPLVAVGQADKAVLICGTGMGMAIVSNKFKGVYAAVVEDVYSAKMCKVINNANILTMGGWIVGPNKALEMVKVWLNTEFTEGFPADRQTFLKNGYAHVQEIEKNN
ncbi:MAG: RpiB/LacA/LacB family sugar-phosphate isomerase [Bacillota bacterium]